MSLYAGQSPIDDKLIRRIIHLTLQVLNLTSLDRGRNDAVILLDTPAPM